jgi:hypothetical protein
VHVKSPPGDVVIVVPLPADPTEQVVGVRSLPLNASVAPELTVKPVAVTVNELPTDPRLGEIEIARGVTVNIPFVIRPPGSTAVTVVPDVAAGTAKVHVNDPTLPVTSEPDVQLVMATLSKVSDESDANTEKPVPPTVTGAPTGPTPGVTVIASTVTVNVPTPD